MINNYIVNSLLYNDDLWNLRVVGKQDGLDIISIDFRNLRYDKKLLLNIIKSDKCILSPTVMIDCRLLKDFDIIEALSYKSETSSIKLRIVNDEYVLNKEDYDRLNFVDRIYVNYSNKFNYNIFKVYKSDGIYARQYERVHSKYDNSCKEVFHIDYKLKDLEIKKLVMDVNSVNDSEIYLNLYDPSYYYEFITKLKHYGLKDNVDITLLSNILVDSRSLFDELDEFNNNIKIVYSSNPEVIDYYMEEPMDSMVNYDNQLEVNDYTDLNTYRNLLTIISNGVEYLRDKAFSPLEAIIWTHKYVLESDINVSKENIYSALLREFGSKVYRYSSLGNSKNIFRVRDKKYNVDNIGIIDFDIDLLEYKFKDDKNNYLYFPSIDLGYSNFIYSPRELLRCSKSRETLSVSNSLVLDMDTYNDLKFSSCDNLEMFYNYNYDNRGNTFKFLELVDLKDEADENHDVYNLYDYIVNINDLGYTDSINSNILLDAIINVEKKENPSLDENDINRIKKSYENSNEIRNNHVLTDNYYVMSNYNILDDGELEYELREVEVKPIELGNRKANVLDKEEVLSVTEDVETLDDFISGSNIKQPRPIRPDETLAEYNVYYREYFNKYLLPVVNSSKNEEEEFIIDNDDPEIDEKVRKIVTSVFDKYFREKEKQKEVKEKKRSRSLYGNIDKEYLKIINQIDKHLKEST